MANNWEWCVTQQNRYIFSQQTRSYAVLIYGNSGLTSLWYYAPVNWNHCPPWSGGVPVIAGEMCRVFTFPMARSAEWMQWFCFSAKNSGDMGIYRGAGAFGGEFTSRLSPRGGDFTWDWIDRKSDQGGQW